jgi:hypothetical protein
MFTTRTQSVFICFSTRRSSCSPSRDVVSSRSPQVSPATWSQPLITLCGLRLRCLAAPSPCASAEASRGARFHRFPPIQREWFRLQVRPRWCGRRAFGTWRARQQTHTATHLAHNSQLSCVWLPSARDSSRNTRRAIVLGASGPTIYVLGEMTLPRARDAARKCTSARERRGAHACARARTPVRMRPCARARARGRRLSSLRRVPPSTSAAFPGFPLLLRPSPHTPLPRASHDHAHALAFYIARACKGVSQNS